MTSNGPTVVSKLHDEDCLGCRLVSGFGVIGMGTYLFYQAKRQTAKLNKSLMLALSVGTCGIGISRLLALPPFRKKSSDAEWKQNLD